FPAVLIKGRSGIDYRGDGDTGIQPIGDAVGKKEVPCMGMIYNFGIIGNPIGLFLSTLKMSKGFEIPVIHAYLKVALAQKITFQAISYTGRKVSNGHTSLGI